MTLPRLSALDERVLRALPFSAPGGGRWLTVGEVAALLDTAAPVVQRALARLRGRMMADDDGGWPRRWARTARGDRMMEWAT